MAIQELKQGSNRTNNNTSDNCNPKRGDQEIELGTDPDLLS